MKCSIVRIFLRYCNRWKRAFPIKFLSVVTHSRIYRRTDNRVSIRFNQTAVRTTIKRPEGTAAMGNLYRDQLRHGHLKLRQIETERGSCRIQLKTAVQPGTCTVDSFHIGAGIQRAAIVDNNRQHSFSLLNCIKKSREFIHLAAFFMQMTH
jgi:hypothetical protein